MKVVILCGGRGERMRPLTDDRPKPLVEVGGRPLLWHVMKPFVRHGFKHFVLACGYKGGAIGDWVTGHGRYKGAQVFDADVHSVRALDTGEDTQTGGRLLRVKDYLDGDTFLCTYGDGLSDVNLTSLVAFHRSHGKAATVTAVKPRLACGMMELDPVNGVVMQFVEKPVLSGTLRASAGFFCFQRSVLDRIVGDGTRLEDSTLPRLANEGELVAFKHGGFFKGCDTPADVAELNRLWDEGKAPWRTWE